MNLHRSPDVSDSGSKLRNFLSTVKTFDGTNSVLTAAINATTPPVSLKEMNIKLPPIKELEKKWGNFANHSLLYNTALDAFAFVGKVLTAKEFKSYKGNFYESSPFDYSKSMIMKDDNFFFMSLDGKTIQTKMTIQQDIDVNIDFAKEPQALMDAESAIKAYFPAFKMPTKWTREEKEDQSIRTKTISLGDDMVVTIPLERMARIKPRFTSFDPKDNDKQFSIDKKFFTYHFDKVAELKLTLKTSDIVNRDAKYGEVGGVFTERSTPIVITLSGEVIFNWPTEMAYYSTCAGNYSQFIPFLFYQYITWHRIAYGGGRGRGGGFATKIPSRINNIGAILERNDSERKAGRVVKPRTNKDGFLILGVGEPSKTGNIYWIPDNINKVGDYVNQIKSAYDPTKKTIDLTKVHLKGEGLLTDWYNEKFTYFREEGVTASTSDVSGIQTIDLTGSVPLDNVTIYIELNKAIYADEKKFDWFFSIIGKFINGDWKDATPAKPYATAEYMTSIGIEDLPRYIDAETVKSKIKAEIGRFNGKITWANLGGYPLTRINDSGDDVSEKSDPAGFKKIRSYLNLTKIICADLLNQIDKIKIAYADKLDQFRFTAYMIGRYGANTEGYKAEHTLALEANKNNEISDAAYNSGLSRIKMANLPGVTRLMPHQVESAIELEPNPLASLVEVSAGGGKTLIDLMEISNLLYDKKANRALVIVPGNLVRNWVNEIGHFSKGKLNAFALTIQSLRRLQYAYNKIADPTAKPDYPNLKKIILSMPPNTVFVTSYRFLINDREDLVYGNKVITRLYVAEFLRDLGFDYCAIDESHYAKNLDSLSTLGVSIVLSASKYKRGLSGTTVIDTLKDLIGQAGVMVPPALGNESRFLTNYGSTERGAGEWREGAPTLITNDMRPYIKRMVHKRSKWAAMLPPLREQFHSVRMTEKQAEFYNALLQQSIEDLRKKNPKLYTKLIDGNESDARAIEQGLNTYFAAIEQFLYAPDSNEAFTQLEDLDPSDLVSPKIAKVIQIIDNHFNGFTDEIGRKHDPDPYKIIIFSHRVQTSKHVMKHLPERLQKIAIRYEAGDFKALQSFLKDDRVKILVADELSINTGQNLQLASRMIRLETLWSPGAQEQAIARIWRPAFKEGSDRAEIYMDWIYTNMSLEVAKIARLISKILTKTKYDQQDNRRFTTDKYPTPPELKNKYSSIIPTIGMATSIDSMLGQLKLIKMNSQTILKMNNTKDLLSYFGYYSLINSWEEREFDFLKNSTRYSKLVDLPKSAYVEIPNSKTVLYSPRVPGVEPAIVDPEDKIGYKPISVIENEIDTASNDDEEERVIEINPVTIGELVNTEFGFGRVTKLLQTDIWVDIKGLGEVKVPKATAWIIGNEDAKREVIRRLKQLGETGDVRLPAVVKALIKNNSVTIEKEEIEDEEEEEVKKVSKPGKTDIAKNKFDDFDDDEDEEEETLPIWAKLIDTRIALTADATIPAHSILNEKYGFKVIEEYTAIKIGNVASLNKILNLFKGGTYDVPSRYIENFDYYRTMLQNHSFNVAEPGSVAKTMRFFAIDDHKKLLKGQLRPYPVIWNNAFFMAFNKARTPSVLKFEQQVKKMALPGVSIVSQDELYVKFYPNSASAIDDLNKLNGKRTNPDYQESLKFLKSIKVRTDSKQKQDISDIEEEVETNKKRFVFQLNNKNKKPDVIKLKVAPKVAQEVPRKPVVTPTKPQTPTNRFVLKLNLRGFGKPK